MPWLLFISSINFVRLLFESSNYSRVVFISLSQSFCWRGREWSSIEWLLDRQGNLLVVADWFTSFFRVCFASSWQVFVCACATQVFVAPTVATIWEWRLFRSAYVKVRLLFKSGVWSNGYSVFIIMMFLYFPCFYFAFINLCSFFVLQSSSSTAVLQRRLAFSGCTYFINM